MTNYPAGSMTGSQINASSLTMYVECDAEFELGNSGHYAGCGYADVTDLETFDNVNAVWECPVCKTLHDVEIIDV